MVASAPPIAAGPADSVSVLGGRLPLGGRSRPSPPFGVVRSRRDGSPALPLFPSGRSSRGLLPAALGRQEPFPLPPLRGLLGTTAPFDSLAPSSPCCHGVYPSRRSGFRPPGSRPRGFPHLGDGEGVGSPRVAMRTRYPHAHLTHPAAGHRVGFPGTQAGRPSAAELVVGSFPLGLRACPLHRLPAASLRWDPPDRESPPAPCPVLRPTRGFGSCSALMVAWRDRFPKFPAHFFPKLSAHQ